MAALVPTMEVVIAAVISETASITTPENLSGKVTDPSTFPSVWETLKTAQIAGTGKLDRAFVTAELADEIEGLAAGENYSIYTIIVEYYNIRKNATNWKRQADLVAESIRDKLNKNAAVFAIGGQRQVQTPETVSLRSTEFTTIADEHGDEQMIYKAEIVMAVEARRFA